MYILAQLNFYGLVIKKNYFLIIKILDSTFKFSIIDFIVKQSELLFKTFKIRLKSVKCKFENFILINICKHLSKNLP